MSQAQSTARAIRAARIIFSYREHILFLFSEVIRANDEVISWQVDNDFSVFVVIVITTIDSQFLQSLGDYGAEEESGVGFIGGDVLVHKDSFPFGSFS
jgi:hypothetical protein